MNSQHRGAGERSRLSGMFERDSETHLDSLRRFLDSLTSGAGFSLTALNRGFRAAHSLKSEAGFLGYTEIVDQAHKLEDTLETLRGLKLEAGEVPGEELMQRLAVSIEELERLVRSQTENALPVEMTAGMPAADSSAAEAGVRRVGSARSRLFNLSPVQRRLLREAKANGEQLYEARITLSGDTVLTYARLYLLLSNLETVVSVVRTDPDPDELTKHEVRELSALFTTAVDEQRIYSALDIDQVAGIDLVLLSFDEVLDLAASGDSGSPGMLLGRAGVILSLTPRNYELLSMYSHELMTQLDAALERISPDSEMAQRIHRELRASRVLAARVNSTLARTSLVPLSRIFASLYRFVEEHAATRSKEVVLVVEGEREQLFLPVAEVLSDALLHLLRNSIDHGIEPPDERSAAGKTVPAVLRVSVSREGEKLCVRVRDDGRGVDADTIRRRAGDENAASPASSEHRPSLLRLMMTPGVTTRNEADHGSGRGVGLDAVRHAVENLLGGSIELETDVAEGVSIAIRVPNDARLLTVLVFEAGSRTVAVPAAHVIDTFPIQSDAIRQDIGGESYYCTESGVARIFTVAGEGSAIERYEGQGILLSVDGRQAVVLADRLISEEVVVRRPDQPNTVYSRTCGDQVSLFIPVSL